MAEISAQQSDRTLRAAVVGVSESRTCGVRDHAVLLADALDHEGISCSMHWLWRSERTLRGARSEFLGWSSSLAAEIARGTPSAIVLHYSVFSYSYRGFPVFVRPALAAVRRTGLPLIAMMHELAYPWHLGGVHGKAWTVTQRALLIDVMRASTAVVVTAPFRADWLASRRWLPRRPMALAPVFSNLPAPSAARARASREGGVIGLFGYAYEGAAVSLVLDALRTLHDRGLEVRMELLGAPGSGSAAAEAWLDGARARGIEHALSFSGVLPAQELSDALSDCDVLLHPEPSGPTSRKGTLAASLASGTAVVAIDGPRRWSELVESEAALVVQPTASAVADALAMLLADEHRRESLGARGAEFARQAMSVQRSARVVAGLIDELSGPRARARRVA
jgi:glycosyltransferase involved in cell wall biosynthesis